MQDLSIQNAFLDGMKELWGIVFTEIDLYPIDTISTPLDDVYGEPAYGKSYLPQPVKLLAKADLKLHKQEDETLGKSYNAEFKVPTKSLLENDIRLDQLDILDTIRAAKITFNDVDYEIEDIRPQVNIQGVFMFYLFICKEV